MNAAVGMCVSVLWAQCGRPCVSEKILCCWELLLRAAAGGIFEQCIVDAEVHLCEVAYDAAGSMENNASWMQGALV